MSTITKPTRYNFSPHSPKSHVLAGWDVLYSIGKKFRIAQILGKDRVREKNFTFANCTEKSGCDSVVIIKLLSL